MALERDHMVGVTRRVFQRERNMQRVAEDLIDRLVAVEAAVGAVADGEDDLATQIAAAQATADEANAKITRVGLDTALDTSGAALVYDAGFDWPDSIFRSDMYLVSVEMGAGVDVAQIIHGDELLDLSDGAAGATALTSSTGIELWQVTGANAVREVAKLGKSASGDVLFDPALTGNANTLLGIYRITI